MGIMMLAALAILESGDFHKSNAIKNAVAFLVQIVSSALLIAGGLIHWPQAFVTMAASVAGGYLGVGIARRVPEQIIRAVVVTVGAALTVVFFPALSLGWSAAASLRFRSSASMLQAPPPAQAR